MSETVFQQQSQQSQEQPKRRGRPPKRTQTKLTRSDSRSHQAHSPPPSRKGKGSQSQKSESIPPPQRRQFRFNKSGEDDASSDTLTIDTDVYHNKQRQQKERRSKFVVDDDVQSVLTAAFRGIMADNCDDEDAFTEVPAPPPSMVSYSRSRQPEQLRHQLVQRRQNPFLEDRSTRGIPQHITLPTSRAMANTWNSLISEIKTEFESDVQNGTEQPDKTIINYHNLMMFVSFCTNISSVVIENISGIIISGVATIETMFQSYKVLLILSVDENDHKCLFVFRDTDKQFKSHRLASVECEKGFVSRGGVSYYKMKLINRTHNPKTETTFVFTHESERDMFVSKIDGKF